MDLLYQKNVIEKNEPLLYKKDFEKVVFHEFIEKIEAILYCFPKKFSI